MKYDFGIVIPTYNEKANIESLIEKIELVAMKITKKFLVLVVDDGSPDGTGDLVQNMINTVKVKQITLRLMRREGKQGLASAYIQGFNSIIGEVSYLVSMDADHSHDPIYLLEFEKEIQNNTDVIVGSRYIKGGGIQGWGLFRKFISRVGSLYSQTILQIPIRDLTGGYNCYKSSIFDTYSLSNIKAEGYLFQIEMKYRLFKQGFKVKEVPIIFTDRILGASKISRRIMIEAFFGVFRLKFQKTLK